MNELAVLHSRALCGMQAPEVQVEVHLANGLPSLTIVGLPDAAVREARDRVRAAIQHAGMEMPRRRMTVNLSPADLPKASSRFDLPIALGILAASGQIDARTLGQYAFAGELSLSGQLRPIQGALATALALARSTPARAFILPRDNAPEASLARGLSVLPAASLLEVCAHFSRHPQAPRLQAWQGALPLAAPVYPDLAEVCGQQAAKRALEIAAAGSHSLLMIGPPGAGKTMLAMRFPGLLPPLDDDAALEVAALQSLDQPFRPEHWGRRPFRAPHHSASAPALVGGSSQPRPGEISLAHGGVLFLDELPEFPRHVLEVLRQPLEAGTITVSRAARQSEFPARFQLLAAMNPCPCGYLGQTGASCRCTREQIARYQQRISGPLLDRIDLRIDIAPVSSAELTRARPGESTAQVAARVAQAHARQQARQGCTNAHLEAAAVARHCHLNQAALRVMRDTMRKFQWSARSFHRVLRVARTIADLAGHEAVEAVHVGEAAQLRRGLPEADQ
ncbi:YifB family Mg chelatase-like AAA ATPase [Massilia sp. TS11]|uniref:YifB family Mg chelatase-like AAA ATPase n=1 Tax=Massilia sp. TS11 TaxID=2908003 RepID=UPI001EDBDA53|nr:YifB family Mg chelatase-like AAA ATPase [Massilia sp. TS11]MCG2585510.1 YifB family Mg chelatase-like AAA ATPase [Massilia sp. TS11]